MHLVDLVGWSDLADKTWLAATCVNGADLCLPESWLRMHAVSHHLAVGFACSEAETRTLMLTPERFCIEAQDVQCQLSTLTVWRC